jgi:hypothetical protein
MSQERDIEFGRICRQVSNQLSQAIRILEDAKDKCLRTKHSVFQRLAMDEEAGIQKTIEEIRQLITKVQAL